MFVVGGCVRDWLLGGTDFTDLDFVVEGDALAAAECITNAGAASDPQIYPRFGTAMVVAQGTRLEFAIARSESYSEESRKPLVEPSSLKEDAERRDFTVNSLMYDPWAPEPESRVIDLLGTGLADLWEKVLRTPKAPDQTFSDDPLRMLRAVRFKHKLGFEFEQGLADSIKTNAHRIEILSAERIQEEFIKMLHLPDPGTPIIELAELGLLEKFAPELVAMQGVDQGEYHFADVFDHSIAALRAVKSDDIVLKLSALLHDIGKPSTKSIEESGRVRFFNHEVVGADMAAELMDRLRFGSKTISRVHLLIRNHMRFTSFKGEMSASAARRLLRDLGDETENLLILAEADKAALKKNVGAVDLNAIRKKLQEVSYVTPKEKIKSPLSGKEVMQILNVEQGPKVGEALRLLEEAVIEGDLEPDDKDTARRLLLDS